MQCLGCGDAKTRLAFARPQSADGAKCVGVDFQPVHKQVGGLRNRSLLARRTRRHFGRTELLLACLSKHASSCIDLVVVGNVVACTRHDPQEVVCGILFAPPRRVVYVFVRKYLLDATVFAAREISTCIRVDRFAILGLATAKRSLPDNLVSCGD